MNDFYIPSNFEDSGKLLGLFGMEVKKYLLNLGQQYTCFLMKNCIDIHLDTYFREQRDILPENILEIKPYIIEKSFHLDGLALNALKLGKCYELVCSRKQLYIKVGNKFKLGKYILE